MALVNNDGLALAPGNSASDWQKAFQYASGNIDSAYNSPSLSTMRDYSRFGDAMEQIASGDVGGSTDITGYDQAEWEYQKQLELLADQRAYNSAEAQKNRDWQERMSNSAYQRAVKDLEAAGLNKWLAVTGGASGASASTPSGSSATSSAGDASQPNPTIYKALLQFYSSLATSAMRLIDFF